MLKTLLAASAAAALAAAPARTALLAFDDLAPSQGSRGGPSPSSSFIA